MNIGAVRITPELLQAIEMLRKDRDWTETKLASVLKTNATTIYRWRTYQAETINKKTAKILMPLVQPFLDEILAEKEREGANTIPQSIEDIYEKLKLLKDADPKALKSFCDLLDASLKFAGIFLLDNKKKKVKEKKPAKIKIKKLTKKALAERLPHDNFYTSLDEMEEIEAAAGTGCYYDYEYSVPVMADRRDIDVINVVGNSMEPYIREGTRIIVQRFADPIDFEELYLPLDSVKTLVPDGSVVIYNLNDSGLAIKRVRYQIHEYGQGPEWSLYLDALNGEWAEENGFPKRITMQDRLLIYGKMIGQAG